MNESVLNKYGVNYTQKNYITNPAIGRDKEINEVLILLLDAEKSAILVGEPGVGKTAVVEGLAYRIKNGDVPLALQNTEIINVQTAALLGTTETGESKVQLLIKELKDKPNVILFIDEIHMLIGSTSETSLDFANIFKEGLGRGGIKIVGATTNYEYEKYILRDKAFVRRFQRVDISELDQKSTVEVMKGTLKKIEEESMAKLKYTSYIQEQIFKFIVDITSEYKRVYGLGSKYPDCSLTILKLAFSYARFENRKEVTIYDIENAIKNTKLIYDDVKEKSLPLFYETFKEIYKEEEGETTKEDEIEILDITPEVTYTPSKIVIRKEARIKDNIVENKPLIDRSIGIIREE
mgnify:CR=1 FL=1